MLFDTGASVPVWCVGYKRFRDAFPDAKKQDFKYILSGFGRTDDELKEYLKNQTKEESKFFLTDVYSVLEFSLSTGGNKIIWKNLQVAVTTKRSIGADLILPSTMFRGMEFRWNQKNINKPYLEIDSECDTKYAYVQLYIDKSLDERLLKYIYSQDDTERGVREMRAF